MIEGLKAGNFMQEPGAKHTTQEWVRASIIPRIIERNYSSARALNALHYASTWNLSNVQAQSTFERYEEAAEVIGALDGKTPEEATGIVNDFMEGKDEDIVIELPSKKGRGRYRKAADVRMPKAYPGKAVSAWSFRAIQTFTREGEKIYVTPQVGVDELMSQLCENYDSLERSADNDPVKTAMNVGYLYTIGNRIIHPYIDGNHRAFDRFMELSFKKAGIPLELPGDSTGNIPADDLFRSRTTNMAMSFLSGARLPYFRTLEEYERFGISRYQNYLYLGVQDLIATRMQDPGNTFFYAMIAEEILKWTGQDHSEQLEKVKQKAIKDGNLTVVHRKT